MKGYKEKSRREEILTISKEFDGNKNNFHDLNDLARRLIFPYKFWLIFSLVICFISLILVALMIKSPISMVLLVVSLISAIISYVFKRKLDGVKEKIYMWGVEGAWEHYKMKK